MKKTFTFLMLFVGLLLVGNTHANDLPAEPVDQIEQMLMSCDCSDITFEVRADAADYLFWPSLEMGNQFDIDLSSPAPVPITPQLDTYPGDQDHQVLSQSLHRPYDYPLARSALSWHNALL